MLTLTLRSDVDGTRITEFWNRLLSSLRKYGIKFQYLWIKELTQKGQRHLHVLIDRFVRKSLIRRLWLHATEGTSYIVKINHRPIRSAAGYISKYVTKDMMGVHGFKHKERRYTFSRGFNLPKAESSHEWAFEYCPNYNNLNHEVLERLTIVKRQREEALRKTLELFPDIYKKWRSAYEWRQKDAL